MKTPARSRPSPKATPGTALALGGGLITALATVAVEAWLHHHRKPPERRKGQRRGAQQPAERRKGQRRGAKRSPAAPSVKAK